MFGVGFTEVLVILLVALLVLGPEKLPDLAKQIGKGLRELRRTSNELQSSLQEAMYTDDSSELRRDRPAVRPPKLDQIPFAAALSPATQTPTPAQQSPTAAAAPAPAAAVPAAASGTPDAPAAAPATPASAGHPPAVAALADAARPSEPAAADPRAPGEPHR